MQTKAIPQTQLWIGEHDALNQRAIDYLINVLSNGDTGAAERITQKQHASVFWQCMSGRQYKRSDFEQLHHTLSFARDPGDHYFFIIEYADCLTHATGNSLLKALEEPPAGYHFILLAARKELVLPTIISRSIITEYEQSYDNTEYKSFLAIFKNTRQVTFCDFNKELWQLKTLHEYKTRILVDDILYYWITVYKNALTDERHDDVSHAHNVIKRIEDVMQYLPISGGVIFFWRHVFAMLKMM
jgi:DNA polymerase-3 subunit delta'